MLGQLAVPDGGLDVLEVEDQGLPELGQLGDSARAEVKTVQRISTVDRWCRLICAVQLPTSRLCCPE